MKIVLWSSPAHLSNSSGLLQEHPDWIAWRRNGTPADYDWGDITGTSLRSGYYDYAVDRYRHLREATGFGGIWLDSFLTFGVTTDFREAQPRPQLDRVLQLERELVKMGVTEIHLEGCGPFGLSTCGYPAEPYEYGNLVDRLKAIGRAQRIRGREYGLYRYLADNLVEPGSYYRALAAKGAIGVFNLRVIDRMDAKDRRQIVQANRDYVRVVDRMERRQLIGSPKTWNGVAWTRSGARERILFAFGRFHYPPGDGARIEDITSGVSNRAPRTFLTEPWHTYVIH
ncbi:MAG: hypothetical protein GWP08_21310 [Nitrospiraceae bacterium]|nr:hypothetical protein [Nitrospiraceae bacterium]